MKNRPLIYVFLGWLIGSIAGSVVFYIPIVAPGIVAGKLYGYSGTSNWILGILFMFQTIFILLLPSVIGAIVLVFRFSTVSQIRSLVILSGLGALSVAGLASLRSKYFPEPSLSLEFAHIFLTILVATLALWFVALRRNGVEQDAGHQDLTRSATEAP